MIWIPASQPGQTEGRGLHWTSAHKMIGGMAITLANRMKKLASKRPFGCSLRMLQLPGGSRSNQAQTQVRRVVMHAYAQAHMHAMHNAGRHAHMHVT